MKVNVAYTSDPDPTGLPKATVDEIEVLSGGALGKNTNYFIEQYVVDGGRPGLPRDAWIGFNGEGRHLKLGQFELPLPVEVESERDTLTHYALYDQTVGANTFNFFDPRMGLDAALGAENGLRGHVLLLHAYDRQTATPRSGVDVMASLEKTAGNFTLQTYRYVGQRNFATQDRFWRQGYAAAFDRENFSLSAVLQTGNDSSADGAGTPAFSSGGFLESKYYFSDALSAVARYEGASDTITGMQPPVRDRRDRTAASQHALHRGRRPKRRPPNRKYRVDVRLLAVASLKCNAINARKDWQPGG